MPFEPAAELSVGAELLLRARRRRGTGRRRAGRRGPWRRRGLSFAGLFGSSKSSESGSREARRPGSAADMDDVSCPEPALALARTASTRGCCPARQRSGPSSASNVIERCVLRWPSTTGASKLSVLEEVQALGRLRWTSGRTQPADSRLPGQGPRGRRRCPLGRGRAGVAVWRLGRRRLDRCLQAAGRKSGDLPRHVQHTRESSTTT